MKKLFGLFIVLAVMTAGLYAYASRCPFVDQNTGLECLGVPMPTGVCVAGSKYRCTQGHTWIEKD